MTDLSLDKNYETLSTWWLPENRDRLIPGLLKYSEAGAVLTLQDSIEERSGLQFFPSSRKNFSAIHGRSHKGEALTLWNATLSEQSFSFGSGGRQTPETLASSRLFVGAWLPETHRFPSIQF